VGGGVITEQGRPPHDSMRDTDAVEFDSWLTQWVDTFERGRDSIKDNVTSFTEWARIDSNKNKQWLFLFPYGNARAMVLGLHYKNFML
jgi:hypothetical protein